MGFTESRARLSLLDADLLAWRPGPKVQLTPIRWEDSTCRVHQCKKWNPWPVSILFADHVPPHIQRKKQASVRTHGTFSPTLLRSLLQCTYAGKDSGSRVPFPKNKGGRIANYPVFAKLCSSTILFFVLLKGQGRSSSFLSLSSSSAGWLEHDTRRRTWDYIMGWYSHQMMQDIIIQMMHLFITLLIVFLPKVTINSLITLFSNDSLK